jgi:hypothetical protein
MRFLRRPSCFDVSILTIFTILITLHPYYLHGEINLFELGIYLPGINALLDGLVPYRDFFHLRGPLELYVPALFMKIFGENVSVLVTYFYVGTVVTLILGVFLAKELYRTRLVLYLLIPVYIGRTFPRVVFTNWGGMRYALGFLAVLWAIYFFKQKKLSWLLLAGIASAAAFLTSVEIGVCSIISISVGCVFHRYFASSEYKPVFRELGIFLFGIAVILFPYGIYLLMTGSMEAYVQMTYAVATKMTDVFSDQFLGHHPQTFMEALLGMSPLSPHFKHLTPAYCYLFFIGYCVARIRRKKIDNVDAACVSLAVYGLMMYATAFRKIGASQFEMALQPEKIILFFMLEGLFIFLLAKQKYFLGQTDLLSGKAKAGNLAKIYGVYFLVVAFIMSSLGYAAARYNKRFFAFQYIGRKMMGKETDSLIPLDGVSREVMMLDRVKGLVVPVDQAENFKQLTQFIHANTGRGEPVFMFPELGSYSFIVDRPFVGRFPMATFSWIGNWHGELLQDLKTTKPRYVVLAKDPGETFPKAYFKIRRNKDNYDEMMDYIAHTYAPVSSTPDFLIYQLR